MKTSAIASVLAAFLPLAGPAMKAQDRADSIAAVIGASCPEELEESEVQALRERCPDSLTSEAAGALAHLRAFFVRRFARRA